MELSDEDRKRIYEEEKLRLEVREELKQKEKSKVKWWQWILAIALLMGLFKAIEKPNANNSHNVDVYVVYGMAQHFVEAQLKSPKSAQFAPTDEMEWGLLKGTTDQYIVRSYVDSQNGFGALIRTKFEIVMKYDKARDLWNVVSFKNLN